MDWNPLVPELTVLDFPESLQFYTDLLGFRVRHRRDAPAFAYLELGGAQLMIEAGHPGGWAAGPLDRPLGRGVNLQVEVADLGPVLARLAAAGHLLFRAPAESWYDTGDALSGQREFVVQDPDGYLLRFCQHLGDRPKP
ncbi:MAG: VOC family protein [Gemmataceae bacterium]|nr:VOC family protein [Gemmataceae bacterium]